MNGNAPRLLLTGFGTFGAVLVNPTQALMEAWQPATLSDAECRTALLEVDYELAERQFNAAVEALQPQVVLAFGVAPGRAKICVERVAVNLDCSAAADNAGRIRQGEVIAATGPPAYWARTPSERILTALQAEGLPARYSGSAGGYLCNHVFYLGCHRAATSAPGFRMGFLHVPLLAEREGDAGLTLTELLRGARAAASACLAQL